VNVAFQYPKENSIINQCLSKDYGVIKKAGKERYMRPIMPQ